MDAKVVENGVVKSLTALQRKTLEKRLLALREDYPIKGLKLIMQDGERVTWGELPAEAVVQKPNNTEKKKRTRTYIPNPNVPRGAMTEKCKPWVELAMSAPGEVITIRKGDFEGHDLERVSRCLSGHAINTYGRGSFSLRKVSDEVDGYAYQIWAWKRVET